MNTSRLLTIPALLGCLWFSGGATSAQASTAEQNDAWRLQNTPRAMQPDSPVQPNLMTPQPQQSQPWDNTQGDDAEQDHRRCDDARVVATAHCEPTPGSPLSAFPLVFNATHIQEMLTT